MQGFRANGLTTPADDLTGNGEDYSFGGGIQIGALIKNIADVIDFGIVKFT